MVHQRRAVASSTASYEVSTHFRPALNHRNRKNRVSPCFSRRKSRAMAGLNVRELNAEKVNEITIVMANWL